MRVLESIFNSIFAKFFSSLSSKYEIFSLLKFTLHMFLIPWINFCPFNQIKITYTYKMVTDKFFWPEDVFYFLVILAQYKCYLPFLKTFNFSKVYDLAWTI